jgi:predicted GNAT superfamily acetyltransferase
VKALDLALALNNAHATELSLETEASFQHLVDTACLARWTEGLEGFVLAFDETAARSSENFQWFKARYATYVYVDRVVVHAHHRGQGHARALYAAVFAQAVHSGRSQVLCEVNLEPANPASAAFHRALGFVRVGEGLLAGGKRVEYLRAVR